MPAMRYFPGTTITLSTTVYVGQTPTDSAPITFLWRMGNYGDWAAITPTDTGAGTYEVQVTPLIGGNLNWRWDTEGTLNTATEGTLSIADSKFDITA